MKVLRVEPRKMPEVIEIDNTLNALQKQVNGYIQAIYPFDDPVAIVCNEEGKIMDLVHLEENRLLRDEDGTIIDLLVGTFLVVGLGDEDFDSLSDDLIVKYNKYFMDNGPVLIF